MMRGGFPLQKLLISRFTTLSSPSSHHEGFSRRTANNRSPPTFESRESHFVSRSIHAFHVLGGQLVQPYMLDIVLTYLYHVQVS